MVRHLKVLAISMLFTTVAMGFAYALPSALRGAASQASEELEMVEEGEPTGEVAAQETEGETGVESGDEGPRAKAPRRRKKPPRVITTVRWCPSLPTVPSRAEPTGSSCGKSPGAKT